MKILKLIKIHAAAAAATVITYSILTGGDPRNIAAMMLLYLWMLVTLADADMWICEKKEKRHGRHERNKTRSGYSAGTKFGIDLALKILGLEDK